MPDFERMDQICTKNGHSTGRASITISYSLFIIWLWTNWSHGWIAFSRDPRVISNGNERDRPAKSDAIHLFVLNTKLLFLRTRSERVTARIGNFPDNYSSGSMPTNFHLSSGEICTEWQWNRGNWLNRSIYGRQQFRSFRKEIPIKLKHCYFQLKRPRRKHVYTMNTALAARSVSTSYPCYRRRLTPHCVHDDGFGARNLEPHPFVPAWE